MAEEIFAAFDDLADEVAQLANGKPGPAVLKPQLEELYESYTPTMMELQAKYLALEASDEFAFRVCKGEISTNRPLHITEMESAMVEAIKYYNFELGDQEIVSLLTKRPIELLNIAVNES